MEDRYTPAAYDATVLDPDRIEQRLREGPIWVAEVARSEGTIVGTFGIEVTNQGHYLRGMGVSPGARGSGLGRRLVDITVDYVDARAPGRTWLYTTAFLETAIARYGEAGFVRFDPDPPDFHGTPIIGMERPLTRRGDPPTTASRRGGPRWVSS